MRIRRTYPKRRGPAKVLSKVFDAKTEIQMMSLHRPIIAFILILLLKAMLEGYFS